MIEAGGRMANAAANQVAPLRSEAIQVQPLRIERVFDDPERVIARIEERAPYPTLAKYHGFSSDTGYGQQVLSLPHFRTHLDDDLFLRNPRWIEGAHRAFRAEIVRPLRCILNLNMAAPAGGAHLDLPTFRGSHRWGHHVWLLMSMSFSGLFARWMVPLASGLVWFYRGVGGEFEYWPDGPDRPSQREVPPLWNVGQISDNEYMWHRVGAIGRADEVLAPGVLHPEDELHRAPGAWEIRAGAEVKARIASDSLRISLLWKAYVFADEQQLTSFENHDADLDLAQVVEIFSRDLERRGIPFERPTDPLRDPAWQKLLVESYPPAFRAE
jgi:hypothetical protein